MNILSLKKHGEPSFHTLHYLSFRRDWLSYPRNHQCRRLYPCFLKSLRLFLPRARDTGVEAGHYHLLLTCQCGKLGLFGARRGARSHGRYELVLGHTKDR